MCVLPSGTRVSSYTCKCSIQCAIDSIVYIYMHYIESPTPVFLIIIANDRKWIKYWCIFLLYILWVLWVIFHTLHLLYFVSFLSLLDNSALVANVICWLQPTWNKDYFILSYHYIIHNRGVELYESSNFTVQSTVNQSTDCYSVYNKHMRHSRAGDQGPS